MKEGPKMYGGPFHGRRAWFPRDAIRGVSRTIQLPIAPDLTVRPFDPETPIPIDPETGLVEWPAFKTAVYRLVKSKDALVYEGD